jgi:hypothetical protein
LIALELDPEYAARDGYAIAERILARLAAGAAGAK